VADILLDTNVLSELMRGAPDARVLAWFESQRDAAFHVSAITRAELLLGVALLPHGKRRDSLAAALERMFAEDFADRCLPFDAASVEEYALLVAARTRAGKPISTEDGQIAATALACGLSLATRNRKDFRDIPGLDLLDPWAP
jgi:predicted nucleic acid-binding protein